MNGRLVFLLPYVEHYTKEELPIHPCLELLYVSDQPLSGILGRLLITMKKVKKFDENEDYITICKDHMMKYEESYLNLKDKVYAPKH